MDRRSFLGLGLAPVAVPLIGKLFPHAAEFHKSAEAPTEKYVLRPNEIYLTVDGEKVLVTDASLSTGCDVHPYPLDYCGDFQECYPGLKSWELHAQVLQGPLTLSLLHKARAAKTVDVALCCGALGMSYRGQAMIKSWETVICAGSAVKADCVFCGTGDLDCSVLPCENRQTSDKGRECAGSSRRGIKG